MINKKILVIRYGTIGDTIFASAFFRELRKNLPNSIIDALVDNVAKGIMESCPYIDNIVHINKNPKKIFEYIKIFKQYDTIYFLKNDSFFSIVAFLAGVKNRIGFKVFRNKFLTKTAPYKEDKNEIDCYLDLLEATDLEVKNDKTEIWINDSDYQKVEPILNNVNSTKVLIQAYSRMPEKNWINEYWTEVIEYISDKMGAQIFFVGGKKDREYYAELLGKLNSIKIPPIDLCGELKITETIALVKRSDLLIGIDSGIMHIAAAANTPSILLHGPTSLKRWAPRSDKCTIISKGFKCSPCLLQGGAKELCKNKTPECMKALTPELVINELKRLEF